MKTPHYLFIIISKFNAGLTSDEIMPDFISLFFANNGKLEAI